MKVSKLIRELKKMPSNAEVHVSAHDNDEWETQGVVFSVTYREKQDYEDDVAGLETIDKEMFETMPKQWFCLSC